MRGTPSIYFQSLNQQFCILEVNHQLFYLFVSLCLPIAFSAGLSILMDGIAITLFLFLHIIGVLITRRDPQIVLIYRRHIYYKKYYPAISGIHAKLLAIKPSVPFYQGKRGLV